MKKILIAAAALATLISSPAVAGVDVPSAVGGAVVGAATTAIVSGPNGTSFNCNSLDVSKMSENDIINVRRACESAKGSTPISTDIKPEDVREWATLAQDFGTAVGATAKELGIAVNEFLVTPAGILLTVYLFWSKLGGIIVGVPFIILIWTVYLKILSNYRRTPTDFEIRPVLWGMFNKKYPISFKTESNENVAIFGLMSGFAMIIITSILIGTLIF